MRPIIIREDGTAVVALTRGLISIVDAVDVPLIEGRSWFASEIGPGRGFCAATPQGERMHRTILGVPPGVIVNHRDRDSLNNRRGNLRVREKRLGNVVRAITPGDLPRGVKHSGSGRFQARIKSERKTRHLGSFGSPEEAAKAYNLAAIEMFGEFATITPLGLP